MRYARPDLRCPLRSLHFRGCAVPLCQWGGGGVGGSSESHSSPLFTGGRAPWGRDDPCAVEVPGAFAPVLLWPRPGCQADDPTALSVVGAAASMALETVQLRDV